MRDLGISRCEFDSYWVEADGLAERTRQRVIELSAPGIPAVKPSQAGG